MVYDAADRYVVLFGGGSLSAGFGDTWKFLAGSWTNITPNTSPPYRGFASMAYDAADGYVILFGGEKGSFVFLRDTWKFLAGSWTNITSSTGPSPRAEASMDYDAADRYIVMLGGSTWTSAGSTTFGDTWKFLAGSWSNITPGGSPSPRSGASMVYDAADGYVMLFGGYDGSTFLGDTWKFLAGTWTTNIISSVGPSTRAFASMVYDAADGYVVLFGGGSLSAGFGDTWKFLAGSWTNITSSAGPYSRGYASMVYDAATGYVILFGGGTTSSTIITAVLGDTWRFLGSSWTYITQSFLEIFAPMVYDAADGYVILFGGISSSGSFGETWKFLGGSWTNITPSTGPSPRLVASMAYDVADGYVILFGGVDYFGRNTTRSLSDTWKFLAGSWTNITSSAGPSPGVGIMAYDAADGYVVAFGGSTSTGNGGNVTAVHGNTWKFLGGSWTNITSSTGPSPRGVASMAYDAFDGYVVSFGVDTNTTTNSGPVDTWKFLGGSWTNITTSIGPSPRAGGSMAYDVADGYVILFGGETAGKTTNTLGDTWKFQGGSWTNITTSIGPSPRAGASMAYDGADGYVVLFGGFGFNGGTVPFFSDTWKFSALGTPPAFDYSLSNNGPVSIAAGLSGSVTITAKLTSGTAQSVVLSCIAPLPSGISCSSFSPVSVTPSSSGASSNLRFGVASSVAPGSYIFQVHASPIGATLSGSTTTVTIAVTAVPFDYSLSNNGPVSITQGSAGIVTVTATLTASTAQLVTLSCSGLPSGITCGSFTVNPVTPTGSSGLTVNVASSVAPGSYSFTVTGSPLGATTTSTRVTVNVIRAPVVAPGFAVADFAIGFPSTGVCNSSSCYGPFGLAFDASGSLFVSDGVSGLIYKFPSTGGVASLATQLNTVPISGGLLGLAFTKDGRLYQVIQSPGEVLEINASTGAVIRVVASISSGLLAGLAVDPLSGDLFVSDQANTIWRISNFATGPGTVTAYTTGAGNTDGLAFGSDGTLYAASRTLGGIAAITGTNSTTPGTVTFIASVPSIDGMVVSSNPKSHIVFANRNDGIITEINFTSTTPTLTNILTGGSRGDFVTVGPDGCLYATQSDKVLKVTNADGSCLPPPLGPLTLPPNLSDFHIATNPLSFTVEIGNSGTSTVTLTSVNGFAGVVHLASSVSPAGLTCILSPTSVTGSGASTLRCTSATPGIFAVNVTGTSGTLSHSTTVTVIVTTVPFDYFLSNSGPVSIQAGSSGTVTTTTTLTAGSTRSVMLSCSGLPSGITCGSFTVDPVTPTGSSDLTVSVASSVAPGSYSFQISGTPAGATASRATTTVSLIVTIKDNTSISVGSVSCNIAAGGSSCTATVTATIVDTTTASNIATGTVIFTLTAGSTGGSLSVTTCALTSGSCSVTFHGTTAGIGYIVASYGGDSTHKTSTSLTATVTVTVTTVPFDYALSNSGPVTITQGSSGTVTVTATLTASTAQLVTLSCSGLPTGITCGSFTSNSVTPTGSSDLMINVASIVSPGSHTFMITGSPSGATTSPTTITLYVTAPPPAFDYTLSVNPAVASLVGGSSTSGIVTATFTSGTAQPFSLTVSISPNPEVCQVSSGISPCGNISLNNFVSTSTGATATLTVSTNSIIPPGTYTLTITGTPAGLSHSSATFTFTITAPSVSTVSCGHDQSCSVLSNSTLSNIRLAGNTIHVEATGPHGAGGYANVTVPKSDVPHLDTLHVFVDNNKLSNSDVTITSNSTDYFIYFTFTFHSPVVIDIQLTTPEQTPSAPTILGLDSTLFYEIIGGLVAAVIVAVSAAVMLRRRGRPKAPVSN